MGCRLAGDVPAVATARLFEASQQFLNEAIADASLSSQCQLSLTTELLKQRVVTNPTEFARDQLQVWHRQAYLTSIDAAGVAAGQLQEDISTVIRRLRRIVLEFDNVASLNAPQEEFEDSIAVTDLGDGLTEVRADGRAKRVRG